MIAVFVRASDDHCGLWPRVLERVYRGSHPLPEINEPVELIEEETGEILAMAKVEAIDEQACTYNVRIW